MRQTTCRQTSLLLAFQYQGTCRLHRGHKSLLLAPINFSLAGDRLYQLAQARPHNVLHFLVSKSHHQSIYHLTFTGASDGHGHHGDLVSKSQVVDRHSGHGNCIITSALNFVAHCG